MKKYLRKIWRIGVIMVGISIIFSSLLGSLEKIMTGEFIMAIALIFWTILVGFLVYNFAGYK